MKTKILVTGGTGNNGKPTLEYLAQTETPVRAMLRDPAKAAVNAPNITYVAGDYNDTKSVVKALDGIETAFLVTAFEPTFPAKHAAFIRAAEAAGVNHIVQLSGIGADAGSSVIALKWLGEAEDYLTSSALSWTILRPGLFNNNFFAYANSIAQYNMIEAPFGKSPYAILTLVDNRDVGAVAAEVLLNPATHKGQVYTLTGSEQLNHAQIAGVFSKVLGRHITYLPISEEVTKSGLLKYQVPEPIADSLVDLWVAIREGVLRPPITKQVERILDRKPITFEQFVRDEAYRFQLENTT
jgi:uncharacterized protein YbjT (DUF2867 family)